jgi:hypothetical protein
MRKIIFIITFILSIFIFNNICISKDPNTYTKVVLERILPEIKFDKIPLKDCLE